MEYRLLVDWGVIAILDSIPKRVRSRLLAHFIKLRSTPDQYADFHEYDAIGRRVEISVFAGYSVHYWIDSTDRHVKILSVKSADRN